MLSLLKKRRSIRIFQDKKVEKEKISQIMQTALLVPSSMDANPWKFIIIDDKEILLKLAEAKAKGSDFLAKSPLAVVVLADPEQSDVWVEDASIAATLIMLIAQQLGLGNCWVQLRKRCNSNGQDSEEYVKDLLNIPDNLQALCVVAIGYPGEDKSEKKMPEEKRNDVFLNKYENRYDF